MTDRALMRKVIAKVRSKAEEARDLAGWDGGIGDRGASRMETQAEFYLAGMNGEVPSEWSDLLAEVKKESDPEYSEYARLRRKFEGKVPG
jgi:hypothetical protein